VIRIRSPPVPVSKAIEGYIPFDDLTEEIVVGWLESVLDVPALEAQIEAAIDLINNPIMVQLSLPTQE